MSDYSPGIRVVNGIPIGKSRPAATRLRMRRNVLTPMRDGVLLAMDLLMSVDAEPMPVILIRTPYNKIANLSSSKSKVLLEQLARCGYVVAVQDCRGRFNSDGEFDPYRQEALDGFDTIEWLAKQEWCNGSVGMLGASYNGQAQWMAASQVPSALKAIVPAVCPPGNPFLNEPFWGGIMLMAAPEWMYAMGRRSELIVSMQGLYTQEQGYLEDLPISRICENCGTDVAWWREWLSHPVYDDYWRSHGYEESWPSIRVPALNITGWWDMNFLGAPRNFVGMRQTGASAAARDGQRLVIGPWAHWVNQSTSLNGVDFGPNALTDLDAYTIKFFDYWLRGDPNGLQQDARVHVFVIGANEWWEADEWPLTGTRYTDFYLHSNGNANTHRGDGVLSTDSPNDQPPDVYDSDPTDPIRTLWSMHDGPVDDRSVTARRDVLCYTSSVLEADLDVVGPVCATLYASSAARDCDWHVRLADVDPRGPAYFLCHGAIRARFRHGYYRSVPLEPHRVERFDIDMTAVGIRFLRGHRIRVEIASSWFSRFERNPQTAVANWMTDATPPITARQKIFHNSQFASFVRLPIIPAPVKSTR